MDSDPLKTQRDVGSAVVSELSAAGFDDAEEIGRGGFGIVFRCRQAALGPNGRGQGAHRRTRREPGTVPARAARDGPAVRPPEHRRGAAGRRNRRAVTRIWSCSITAAVRWTPGSASSGRCRSDEVLRLGVKLAGALETAHRAGILHRDIKPANILLHGLRRAGVGRLRHRPNHPGASKRRPASSPVRRRSPPPRSSAAIRRARHPTCTGSAPRCSAALTGHAAFERRSGEQVVAQFLRIASESAPDLRESGVPDDVAAIVEMAMARDPHDRPSVVELCAEIQRVQARHGFPVDEMALRSERQADRPARQATRSRRHRADPREHSAGADQLRRSPQRVGGGEEGAVGRLVS